MFYQEQKIQIYMYEFCQSWPKKNILGWSIFVSALCMLHAALLFASRGPGAIAFAVASCSWSWGRSRSRYLVSRSGARRRSLNLVDGGGGVLGILAGWNGCLFSLSWALAHPDFGSRFDCIRRIVGDGFWLGRYRLWFAAASPATPTQPYHHQPPTTFVKRKVETFSIVVPEHVGCADAWLLHPHDVCDLCGFFFVFGQLPRPDVKREDF